MQLNKIRYFKHREYRFPRHAWILRRQVASRLNTAMNRRAYKM
jgi:hypothetical protein